MEMEIEKTQEYIAVHGDFNVLSSAVYNGGFVKAKTILNVTVSNDFNENAIALFDSFAKEEGLGELVGLMTAVKMENARIVEKEDVTAIITAGIEKPPTHSSSTVNIILLISKNLSPSAMANVIIVATEAKTAAFFDLDVRYQNGELFTGDATDSVVVACYGHENENEVPFAGRATELGRTIYEVVREGVKDALFNHNTWEMDRPILERLEERGISVEDMITTALELYVPVEGDITDEVVLKARIRETIKKECSDVNV
ncbi:MAG TPA: adenosylcobinamide amidohydrolase, partial [Candidatus Bathyarchaeia archaeon]|nr:adenosylcobinamide amidohydrolase [Candidatus Bathyarchaeia archaeon]